ncbi:hypothetical protein [Okeania sp.]|uniref:hypothetical protein n=1 Tax=Okeania sp. TaxID=3100323 RepID=UPI002B4AC7CC|nr:hypothetical protein [Okeania sp.]MEB3340829.1 hypothetical protein [Okeania sp.]
MTTGPIPDETPNNLEEQLLLEQAKAGIAIEIQGTPLKPLRCSPRLVENYGGEPGDWVKMSSTNSLILDGAAVQVHWYRNRKTAQDVEFKFKREYPKAAPRNQ